MLGGKGEKHMKLFGGDFCLAATMFGVAVLSAHAEFKMDRSAMSDKYWSIWNAEEQKKIDEGIETNRKADGVFAIPVPDET